MSRRTLWPLVMCIVPLEPPLLYYSLPKGFIHFKQQLSRHRFLIASETFGVSIIINRLRLESSFQST